MPDFDHVVVLGAGAIGSLYAAKIAPRHATTLVGRPEHVATIERDGLRVVGHEEFVCRMRAVTHLDAIAPRTLVLLTTKVNGNRAAAKAIAGLVRGDTIVLCVQNGLHGERIVQSEIGGRCAVLRAITQFGAIFCGPGLIDYKVKGSTLVEDSPASPAIVELLNDCGLDGRISADIKAEVWRKLIFNCVINPITSMIGSDVGTIADPRLDPLKRLVIDECVRVARADGVTFEIDFIAALAEIFGPSRNTASMRQDLLKGKPTEIDHMNGAVVELGSQHGIGCPVNAALVAIIKEMEGRA